jgi:hypothetical protein
MCFSITADGKLTNIIHYKLNRNSQSFSVPCCAVVGFIVLS